MPTIPVKRSKKEWKQLANELGLEVGGLQAQVDALNIQNQQYAATNKQIRSERDWYMAQYEKILETANATGEVLGNTERDRQELLDQRSQVEEELERANKRLQELYAWKDAMQILMADSPGGDIRGWYWDTKNHRPVLVNGIASAGLKGVAIKRQDKFGIGIQQIPGVFLFEDLVRIDTNIELQY